MIYGSKHLQVDNPSRYLRAMGEIKPETLLFFEAGSDSYAVIDRDDFLKGENQKAQSFANSKIVDAISKS